MGYAGWQNWETPWMDSIRQVSLGGITLYPSPALTYEWWQRIRRRLHLRYLWHLSPTSGLHMLSAERKLLRIEISTPSAPNMESLILPWQHYIHHPPWSDLTSSTAPMPGSCYSLRLSTTEHRDKLKFFFQSSSSDSKRKSRLSPILLGCKHISFGEL